MPAKDHGPQIKNDELYEKLRDAGNSKEKAARIANAQAEGSIDHRGGTLESRSKGQLYDEAKEIGIEGRSRMDKDELVDAIRDH
ncbi:Rho termination factor N-terminal domain-containing protein [Sphingomonas kyeonggiensis]|uniref:Rho termination factor-like N-terminal domain-containing protein n=1 Tax=Sphingomonas kyeonggiensis TaxID=1268553 RepID=A0A7W6NVV5_9SPHN|nr:Rho termination factor N-terminal domain-containing protein [Sphingomonas kyeonggiensis]MBB4097852.1 hypothetical protein [Sphingomonas kyeonggiensis]